MDFFAGLPVDIIHKILSSITTTTQQPTYDTTLWLSRTQFVDTKEALRTSVLSKSFLQQPTYDIIHKILSSITTTTTQQPTYDTTLWLSRTQFVDTKEALRTSVLSKSFLQASSTLPDLNLSCKHSNYYDRGDEEASEARFANHVNHILTRYQQHNISLQTLRLDVYVQNFNFANIIEQLIRKADEYGVVKEIHLNFTYNIFRNLATSVFSYKKLVSLSLSGCDLSRKHCEYLINCSSLRTLELSHVAIDQCLFDKLFHSCPLIEELLLRYCQIEAIKVANLPNLKWLQIFSYDIQIIDVNVPSLELIVYPSFFYLPNIESTQNFKVLCLYYSTITDGQFHNLIANCPVLQQLILEGCDELENIKVSRYSLSFLSLKFCGQITEVNFDAPILTEFDYGGAYVFPSLAFTSQNFLKRKFNVTLSFKSSNSMYDLRGEQQFLGLSEFLKSFKSSNNISLTIRYFDPEINFDNDIINNLRDDNSIIPEFEQVCIAVTTPLSLSAYSSLMEGLLASFSPKILKVKKDKNEDFAKYLCKELLLVEDEDDNPSSSTHSSQSWRNYFKQVKLEGIDKEWRPLHSWKSMEDVLKNLEDWYIMKLSHN